MTAWTIVWRSLRYYWRTHLGVVLGTAIGAMVLIGALLIGDSVKYTLKELALLRIGKIDVSLYSPEHFFREALAEDLKREEKGELVIAPVILLRGNVVPPDRSHRANNVQVLGIDDQFWPLSSSGSAKGDLQANEMHINESLANKLGVSSGETLVLRIEKPGFLSRDAPLSGSHDDAVAIRGVVKSVLTDNDHGRFGLQASQIPSNNIYLPLALIQERLELKDKVNLLLVGSVGSHPVTAERANALLQKEWQLEDLGLSIKTLTPDNVWELRSQSVFIDPYIADSANSILPNSSGVLTYFVNGIRAGKRETPYSIVTALNPSVNGVLPSQLQAGEIVINQWLAKDLKVKQGDFVELIYYVVGERRKLEEQTNSFRVVDILSMTHPVFDRSSIPDFPGLTDAENCRDWEPGMPIILDRIRDKDEAYWDKYRATPKALVSLSAGQEMWSNRWGELTALRNSDPTISSEAFENTLHDQLDVTQGGLYFSPLRGETLAATDSPIDFGQLFIGFSLFLIAASMMLTGLLFVFSVEQRNHEAGLLLAVGLQPKKVSSLLLCEGTLLAIVGSILGSVLAVFYTRIVLYALSTIWSDAVGMGSFSFYAMPTTIGSGIVLSVILAVTVMWFTSRKQLRLSVSQLLGAEGVLESIEWGKLNLRSRKAIGVSIISFLTAILLIGGAHYFGNKNEAATFFSAGSLLLMSGFGFFYVWSGRKFKKSEDLPDLAYLGALNVGRRRGRSLTTTAVLACGVFMVVAVNAFRHSSSTTAPNRQSGTGGFALVGESTMPIYHDLNKASGRQAFALNDEIMKGVQVVPFRVIEGDDASCLNLNRALKPRLLGIDSNELYDREAFRFSSFSDNINSADRWHLLKAELSDGLIPAIADEATVKWALGKSVGDTLSFKDEHGQVFNVFIAGLVAGSILQGNLIVAENRLIEKYPSLGGYRYFLIDAPKDNAKSVATHLTQSLEIQGLELIPAEVRLAEFQSVEHAYISIFQVLGGLGLILGSAGLGVVVARNMLERRHEFALLEAVGFRKNLLRKLVFIEHRWLFIWGLTIGILSASVAIWPTLQSRSASFPLAEMSLLIFVLVIGCYFWTWFAAFVTLRGDLIVTLRSE